MHKLSLTATDRTWQDPLAGLLQVLPCTTKLSPTTVSGQPPKLGGQLLYNGPQVSGLTQAVYQHWLDGDGAIRAFDLTDFTYQQKFIATEKFKAESEAGQPLYRTFGSNFPGADLTPKRVIASPVNVSIGQFADKLLAFGEQSPVYEIDAGSLATQGPWQPSSMPALFSGQSGHPKYDLQRRRLFNFGIDFLEAAPILHLYSLDMSGEDHQQFSAELPYPCSLHDFVITESLAIFMLSPLLVSRRAIISDQATVMGAMSWQPERGSFLLALDLDQGDVVARCPIGRGHVLHLVNGFGRDDDFTVDVIEYDRPYYHDLGPLPFVYPRPLQGGVVRYQVHGDQVQRQALSTTAAADFPAIFSDDQGQPYQQFFHLGMSKAAVAAPKFFDQLHLVSWADSTTDQVWEAPPGTHFSAEPVVIPDALDPLAQWVLLPAFESIQQQSQLLFFNAHSIAAGPHAIVHYETAIPAALHGCHVNS